MLESIFSCYSGFVAQKLVEEVVDEDVVQPSKTRKYERRTVLDSQESCLAANFQTLSDLFENINLTFGGVDLTGLACESGKAFFVPRCSDSAGQILAKLVVSFDAFAMVRNKSFRSMKKRVQKR